MPSFLKDLQLGAQVALDYIPSYAFATGGTNSFSASLVFGPRVAYDYRFTPDFSVGAEANLLLTGGVLFTTLASVQYWF